MRRITYVALLLLAALVLPSLAIGQHPHDVTERIAITATDATADQASAVITRPMEAKGVVAWLKVTAGATLLLQMDMLQYSPTLDTSKIWTEQCPTVGGITGISETMCIWTPFGSEAGGEYKQAYEMVVVPTLFQFEVVHGNATAATYVLYYQWLW